MNYWNKIQYVFSLIGVIFTIFVIIMTVNIKYNKYLNTDQMDNKIITEMTYTELSIYIDELESKKEELALSLLKARIQLSKTDKTEEEHFYQAD